MIRIKANLLILALALKSLLLTLTIKGIMIMIQQVVGWIIYLNLGSPKVCRIYFEEILKLL
jgi:hypothetical protein